MLTEEGAKCLDTSGKLQGGIPCYGTTHADYIYGDVPCVRNHTKEEIDEAYEENTGILIADEFEQKKRDYIATPADWNMLPTATRRRRRVSPCETLCDFG